ncbi:MAG: hypothetical protein MPI95_07120 [Nitrosopumilus sp.]|nr:hypothetical protein [Nitrosopumilus sp.]CAI9831144.1 conserved hypothetical protein [Nitrosopumilaceae archaeon]MDA7941236.1 hypothetical protein [Nitrosopumilus sp.]MDA7942646.1 hypothetical protein [Nitrosopumilus sp.]MDA7945210.1 hypothetical protein [Nitrosopumilus sp.]
MTLPLRNRMHEAIKAAGSMTDADLQKALSRKGDPVPQDRFDKTLLDLEIMGLARVSWMTKDERRIEACVPEPQEERGGERDYEASFPGVGRG